MNEETPPPNDLHFSAKPLAATRRWNLSEDWTAAGIGLLVLAVGLWLSWLNQPHFVPATNETAGEPSAANGEARSELQPETEWVSPAAGWLGKPGSWAANPAEALRSKPELDASGEVLQPAVWQLEPMLGAFASLLVIGCLALSFRGKPLQPFLLAFPCLFLLANFAYLLAGQAVIKNYNLEYALWALLTGLIISNTIGTPRWLRPAVEGELYIKVGLVLLGAGVLFGRLLALGLPGIFVSWVVTPIVLVSTYLFGQKILKITSKSLNMVISADMSVCGVSAAIATAASCKAKKEELSLAIGLSLSFTVIMMVIMPRVVNAMGLDPHVGGAWIGGTIDATGAVAAAGEALGPVGSETAVTIKMIQNILIGLVAFLVAVYWTRWVEPAAAAASASASHRTSSSMAATAGGGNEHGDQAEPAVGAPSQVGIGEIWRRFPKFVLGFISASIVCSLLFASSLYGELWVDATVSGMTKPLRGWLFCLAFVCIGLDTNFRELLPYFRSGKPLVLYLCGQALNVLLTFLMAYLMFGILFKPE